MSPYYSTSATVFGTMVCYTANISGSVSASITEAEKQDIANRVINSTRMQNIETYALAARNMLNGTANGGKSLAAAYDKANSAAANASTAATNAANAVTAANNAKTAAEQPNVFKVVKGTAFTKIMHGEINGSSSGVTAVSSSGSGYTVITGTLGTVGVQRISIGGKNLLFEVVDAPTTSYSASVSLSE